MITLIPEEVNFKISTTDIKVLYTEREGTKIIIDAIKFEDFKDEKYTEIEILFQTVAEVRCITLNFAESNYNNYEVFKINEGLSDFDFWEENKYHPDSGFYQIDNSSWLGKTKLKYDQRNNLNLKHFLIEGYDSYIEILASKYSINLNHTLD